MGDIRGVQRRHTIEWQGARHNRSIAYGNDGERGGDSGNLGTGAVKKVSRLGRCSFRVGAMAAQINRIAGSNALELGSGGR
jgi:hypothetical protein